MKKIAIMQPYFFPYLGYWQLIDAVDTFVVFDDVNYIKRGGGLTGISSGYQTERRLISGCLLQR